MKCKKGWWRASSSKRAYLASMRPYVQTPVLPKQYLDQKKIKKSLKRAGNKIVSWRYYYLNYIC
jgi:hypothetical protein